MENNINFLSNQNLLNTSNMNHIIVYIYTLYIVPLISQRDIFSIKRLNYYDTEQYWSDFLFYMFSVFYSTFWLPSINYMCTCNILVHFFCSVFVFCVCYFSVFRDWITKGIRNKYIYLCISLSWKRWKITGTNIHRINFCTANNMLVIWI
jgi:hypothetical protein